MVSDRRTTTGVSDPNVRVHCFRLVMHMYDPMRPSANSTDLCTSEPLCLPFRCTCECTETAICKLGRLMCAPKRASACSGDFCAHQNVDPQVRPTYARVVGSKMYIAEQGRSIYLEEQPPSDSKMNQRAAEVVHKSPESVSVHFGSCISPPSLQRRGVQGRRNGHQGYG